MTSQLNVSTAAQQARVLAALRNHSITTLDARRELDVLHPAQRILELRQKGYDIRTVWTTQATDAGVKHRMARYILRAGGGR